MKAEEIDAVNTHAGSSQSGDLAEAECLKYLFGTKHENLMTKSVEELVE